MYLQYWQGIVSWPIKRNKCLWVKMIDSFKYRWSASYSWTSSYLNNGLTNVNKNKIYDEGIKEIKISHKHAGNKKNFASLSLTR